MKNIIWLLVLLSIGHLTLATSTDFTGVYSYSKGINKANSTIYICQFKEDSAFVYVQAVSGMPDFFTTDEKGFATLIDHQFTMKTKENCVITLDMNSNILTCTDNIDCKYEFSVAGKYKKTMPHQARGHSTNGLKKGATMMFQFIEKMGNINKDSTVSYQAPHADAKTIFTYSKNDILKIQDEFNGYYLVENSKQKNEFQWVLKKYINLIAK